MSAKNWWPVSFLSFGTRWVALLLVVTLLGGLLPGVAVAGATGVSAWWEDDKEQSDSPGSKATEEDAGADAEEEEDEEEPDRYLAVVGGTLYTVTGGVLRGATMLTKNGKIERIGYQLEIPPEADVLDASGLRVYPGLIACRSRSLVGREPVDANTDVFALNLTLGLASGLTTVVSDNTAAKLTYGTLEGLELKRNLFVTVNVKNAEAVRKLRTELDKIREYHRKKAAYDLEKAAGKDVEEPKAEKLNAGYRQLMEGAAVAKFEVEEAHRLRTIAKLAQEYGFSAVVFGAREGWVVADELGRADIDCVVTPRQIRRRDTRSNLPNGPRIENAAMLYDRGVNVAVVPPSTGISLSGLVGRDLMTLPIEAGFAVRGGMSRQAALESITISAARILGIDDHVGSLEVGKDADFVVTDGDVLHYATLVHYTVVNGRLAYDKNEESLLNHIRPLDGDSRFQASQLVEELEKIHPPEEEGAEEPAETEGGGEASDEGNVEEEPAEESDGEEEDQDDPDPEG